MSGAAFLSSTTIRAFACVVTGKDGSLKVPASSFRCAPCSLSHSRNFTALGVGAVEYAFADNRHQSPAVGQMVIGVHDVGCVLPVAEWRIHDDAVVTAGGSAMADGVNSSRL